MAPHAGLLPPYPPQRRTPDLITSGVLRAGAIYGAITVGARGPRLRKKPRIAAQSHHGLH